MATARRLHHAPVSLLARYPWLPLVTVALLAILAYVNSFPGAFILDDKSLVRDNPLVAEPNLSVILTSDYWGMEADSGLYRPITILSFAVNRVLLGPEVWGFHLVNVVLHALVSMLIFLVVDCWYEKRSVAWLAAALFSVHPIHTEVVNEVVGRGELLAALFGLLALWLARRPGRTSSVLSLLAVAGALLSKEHAVVLLVMIPAVDWLLSEHRRLLRRWSYYLALFLVGGVWLAVRSWGVVREVPAVPRDPFFVPLAFAEPWVRVTTALKLQWQMLGKLFIPVDLQGVYAWADPSMLLLGPASLTGAAILGASAVLLAITARGLWQGKRLAIFSGLYLLAIFPAANLFFATGVTFAERLAYFPSVWFCAAVALALSSLSRLWKCLSLSWVSGFLVLALLLMTSQRNPDFSGPVQLWRANVATAPQNVMAWMYLGGELFERGDKKAADEAFRQMIMLAPQFPEGLRTYADYLLQVGRTAEAAVLAERAVQAGPDISPLSWLLLAEAQYKLGHFAKARQAVDSATPFYQHYWYYWALRGMVLEAQGLNAQAVDSYLKARPWPGGSDLAQRAGLLLLGLGRIVEAEPILRDAVADGGGAAVWNGLGVALALQNKNAEALDAFNTAVKLEPLSLQYRENLHRAQNR